MCLTDPQFVEWLMILGPIWDPLGDVIRIRAAVGDVFWQWNDFAEVWCLV